MLAQLKGLFTPQAIAASMKLLTPLETTIMDTLFKDRPTHPLPLIGVSELVSVVQTVPVVRRDGTPVALKGETASMEFIAPYLPYAAFLISVFSALRLAKFNNDTRQTTSFIGLPVPANALFWASLVAGAHDILISESCHPVYLFIVVCLFSWLLVAEIPMFSLKFKNLSWNDNKISFTFLIVCIPFLVFLGISSFAAIVVWYILLSLFTRKSK